MNEYFKIVKSNIPENKMKEYLNYYINNLKWESDTYTFNNIKVTPLRKTYMYGKDYYYSGQLKRGNPFDETTIEILKYLELKLNILEKSLNACLCNYYENGEASISYHVDDEKEMPENSFIIIFSLGSKRKFYFQPIDKSKSKEIIKLSISEGDILIMNPGCQQYYRHSIPKEKEISEPRVSLTFRTFK
jgi:alkylated DNA repair dioxygenase AlkB